MCAGARNSSDVGDDEDAGVPSSRDPQHFRRTALAQTPTRGDPPRNRLADVLAASAIVVSAIEEVRNLQLQVTQATINNCASR